jgi:ABC-2 type transport system ATP-binding protein
VTAAIQCYHACKSFKESVRKTEKAEAGSRDRRAHRRIADFILPSKVTVEAVKDVSFDVKRGEIFGILGPNGSGKSTLIRMISTLLIPDSGTVRVFGKDVVEDRLEVRRYINRVSVEAAFFKRLSATENLEYAARLYGLDPKEGLLKAKAILARLGFPNSKVDVSLENLSRGMQQKVAIARALMTAPVALLLDEPTTGLDPVSKRDVQDFVLDVRNTHDTTVILTTHDMEEADRLCDRIAVIHDGEFVALDTPENLKRQCANGNGHLPNLEEVFFRLTGRSPNEWETEGEDE